MNANTATTTNGAIKKVKNIKAYSLKLDLNNFDWGIDGIIKRLLRHDFAE
ncbi:hypothetical protein GCM10007916_03770 [Psychromonas marina]|uniref:Uncharacterized protein n=1 Tax=Psychromonas marina TaxID=88364 RepID=A0ABQ6DWE5_9GAMM|nr:hypothetical protein GCM10007916_03770 [Psychromonas marina]